MRAFALGWIVVALLASTPMQAQEARRPIDVFALGPQVGDLIPDFRLPDQDGTMWSRESVMGPNGAMIMFHRSADW